MNDEGQIKGRNAQVPSNHSSLAFNILQLMWNISLAVESTDNVGILIGFTCILETCNLFVIIH